MLYLKRNTTYLGAFSFKFMKKSRMHGQKGALAAPTRIGIAAPGIDRLNSFRRMHPALDIVFHRVLFAPAGGFLSSAI